MWLEVTSVKGLVIIAQTVSAYDHFHDLGAACVDGSNLGVGALTADGVLIHKAGTAMELEAFICHLLLKLRCFELAFAASAAVRVPALKAIAHWSTKL